MLSRLEKQSVYVGGVMYQRPLGGAGKISLTRRWGSVEQAQGVEASLLPLPSLRPFRQAPRLTSPPPEIRRYPNRGWLRCSAAIPASTFETAQQSFQVLRRTDEHQARSPSFEADLFEVL